MIEMWLQGYQIKNGIVAPQSREMQLCNCMHIRRHKDNIPFYLQYKRSLFTTLCASLLFILIILGFINYFAIVTVLLYHPRLRQVKINSVFVCLKFFWIIYD